MKGFRLLLLVMAICLASGVKAQFYDSADDIYYYVECGDNGQTKENGYVFIFNFDGRKAAELSGALNDPIPNKPREYPCVSDVKKNLQRSQTYYDDKIENTEYNVEFVSGNTYKGNTYVEYYAPNGYQAWFGEYFTFDFLNNREVLSLSRTVSLGNYGTGFNSSNTKQEKYKKVDKSFFKVGRSRTPSNTLHE